MNIIRVCTNKTQRLQNAILIETLTGQTYVKLSKNNYKEIKILN